MIEKIKTNLVLILTAAVGILAALFLGQKRKTAKVESELAGAVAQTGIALNDKDRDYAKHDSDAADADYARKLEEYHSSKHDV